MKKDPYNIDDPVQAFFTEISNFCLRLMACAGCAGMIIAFVLIGLVLLIF